MGSRSPAGPRRLGTATRMSASLFRRLSAFFGSAPDQDPKAAKFAVLIPGPTGFPNRAKRSEGSDSAPIQNAPVSPCDPLCAILLAKVSVYPLSPVKTNVSRLCECDLKPLWRGFSLAIWDAPSAYLRQVGRLVEENRSPAEAQRSGFGGKRRRSGMSEFSPFSAETSGMELAVTNSRIKDWRRNRRSAQSLLPAVRAVDGGFGAGDCGVYSEDFLHEWRLTSVKRR